MLRVSEETRERVLRIGRDEFGGVSADETVRRLIHEHWRSASRAPMSPPTRGILDAPAPPDDENAAAGAGVGEGATAGADDPDATADEAVGGGAG